MPVTTSRFSKFQFQTGAIKSASYAKQLADADASFNSKLVRLKGLESIALCLRYRRFNSKLVRLKGHVALERRRTSWPFQFQTGAIKSQRRRRARNCRCCFNSKLVRLKVYGGMLGAATLLFQFQTGAIKRDGEPLEVFRDIASFNSKLVRLKVGWCAGCGIK